MYSRCRQFLPRRLHRIPHPKLYPLLPPDTPIVGPEKGASSPRNRKHRFTSARRVAALTTASRLTARNSSRQHADNRVLAARTDRTPSSQRCLQRATAYSDALTSSLLHLVPRQPASLETRSFRSSAGHGHRRERDVPARRPLGCCCRHAH